MSRNANDDLPVDQVENIVEEDDDEEENMFSVLRKSRGNRKKRKLREINASQTEAMAIVEKNAVDRSDVSIEAMGAAVRIMASAGGMLTHTAAEQYAGIMNQRAVTKVSYSTAGVAVVTAEKRTAVSMKAAQMGGYFKVIGEPTESQHPYCEELHPDPETGKHKPQYRLCTSQELITTPMWMYVTHLPVKYERMQDGNPELQVSRPDVYKDQFQMLYGKKRPEFSGGNALHAWIFFAVRGEGDDADKYYTVSNSSQAYTTNVVLTKPCDSIRDMNGAKDRWCSQFIDLPTIKGIFEIPKLMGIETTNCPSMRNLIGLVKTMNTRLTEENSSFIEKKFFMFTFFSFIFEIKRFPLSIEDRDREDLRRAYLIEPGDTTWTQNVVLLGEVEYTTVDGKESGTHPEAYFQANVKDMVRSCTFFSSIVSLGRQKSGNTYVKPKYKVDAKIGLKGDPYTIGLEDTMQFFSGCVPAEMCVFNTEQVKRDTEQIVSEGRVINEDSKALLNASFDFMTLMWGQQRMFLIKEVRFRKLFDWKPFTEGVLGPEIFMMTVDPRDIKNIGLESIKWNEIFSIQPNIYVFVNYLVGLIIFSKKTLCISEIVSSIVEGINDNFECEFPEGGGEFEKMETGVNALMFLMYWIVTVTVWTVDRLFVEKKYSAEYMRISHSQYERDFEENWHEVPEKVFRSTRLAQDLKLAPKPTWSFTPATVLSILATNHNINTDLINESTDESMNESIAEIIEVKIRSELHSTNYQEAIKYVEKFLKYPDFVKSVTRRNGETHDVAVKDNFTVTLPEAYKNDFQLFKVMPLQFVEIDRDLQIEIYSEAMGDHAAAEGQGSAGVDVADSGTAESSASGQDGGLVPGSSAVEIGAAGGDGGAVASAAGGDGGAVASAAGRDRRANQKQVGDGQHQDSGKRQRFRRGDGT